MTVNSALIRFWTILISYDNLISIQKYQAVLSPIQDLGKMAPVHHFFNESCQTHSVLWVTFPIYAFDVLYRLDHWFSNWEARTILRGGASVSHNISL